MNNQIKEETLRAIFEILREAFEEKPETAPDDESKLFTPKELAERYHVKPATVRQWVNSGRFGDGVVYKNYRSYLITLSGVKYFDQSNTVPHGTTKRTRQKRVTSKPGMTTGRI